MRRPTARLIWRPNIGCGSGRARLSFRARGFPLRLSASRRSTSPPKILRVISDAVFLTRNFIQRPWPLFMVLAMTQAA